MLAGRQFFHVAAPSDVLGLLSDAAKASDPRAEMVPSTPALEGASKQACDGTTYSTARRPFPRKLDLLFLSNILVFRVLVSHYSAIGDTISCDAPYSAIGVRGKFFLRCPLDRPGFGLR